MSRKQRIYYKNRLYYKVCKVVDSQLVSIYAPKAVRLVYQKNIPTIPEYGKLCCFDNEEDARKHIKNYLEYDIEGEDFYPAELWTCSIGNRYTNPYIPIDNHMFLTIEEIFKDLAKDPTCHRTFDPERFPRGTIFTDSITILEKVC